MDLLIEGFPHPLEVLLEEKFQNNVNAASSFIKIDKLPRPTPTDDNAFGILGIEAIPARVKRLPPLRPCHPH